MQVSATGMPSDEAIMQGVERHRSQRKKLTRVKRLLLRDRAAKALAAAAAGTERADVAVAAAAAGLERITRQLLVLPAPPHAGYVRL